MRYMPISCTPIRYALMRYTPPGLALKLGLQLSPQPENDYISIFGMQYISSPTERA